ncbi:MAG TPA: amidase [Burkholderiaceae bacterium]|nr:amidase [Burkholderiaceae bacterium]
MPSPINPFSTLTDLAGALARRDLSALELADYYLARITRANPKLNAFVTVEPELARSLAIASDARRAAGVLLGPLDGLPIALKDLLEIEGRVTTVGSAIWRQRRSKETAVAVERLLAAGMVILGKTQMVEFAFGGWGANPKLGTPWNPWDLTMHRVPGGSSSGSGVAVAAGLAPSAIGSDTGGSVRIPASLVGITGLKTTSGLISLRGAFPLSPTLDTIGPMTRSVDDAALLAAAMAEPELCGHLARTAADPGRLDGRQIMLLAPDQAPIMVDPAVAAAVDDARRVLQSLGARIIERRFPFDFGDLMRRNGQLIAAEAYCVHRAYVEDEALPIGPWVRNRLLSGKAIAAADYIETLAHRRAACQQWIEWMGDADALLTPTLPMAACRVEEVDETTTPLAAFTRAGNYLDACALSLPAGFAPGGLPVGIQLLGKPFDEARLLDIGRAFQRTTAWHLRTPDVSALFDREVST